MHAFKWNHLRHHRHCLDAEDYEAKCATMRWYEAILYGPKHIYLLHKIALQKGKAEDRKRVKAALIGILLFVALILWTQIPFLLYHLVIMIAGEFLSAFVAVWMVHHDCEGETIARTQRVWWKNRLTYSMFYHLEHHLFPAVPTMKLPELARRIDLAAPDLLKKSTF